MSQPIYQCPKCDAVFGFLSSIATIPEHAVGYDYGQLVMCSGVGRKPKGIVIPPSRLNHADEPGFTTEVKNDWLPFGQPAEVLGHPVNDEINRRVELALRQAIGEIASGDLDDVKPDVIVGE